MTKQIEKDEKQSIMSEEAKKFLLKACFWAIVWTICMHNYLSDPQVSIWFSIFNFIISFIAYSLGCLIRDFIKPDLLVADSALNLLQAKILWNFGIQTLLMIIGTFFLYNCIY